MSEFSRISRIARSLIPKIFSHRERYYSFADARMIISDLALPIPPEVLAKILENDACLDDFIQALYEAEQELGIKDLVTDFATIDTKYSPKAYYEEGKVAFSLHHHGKEIIFVEFSE